MVKIGWTCRRLPGDDAGHVLVKDWPRGLRAFFEVGDTLFWRWWEEADRVGRG